MYAQPLLCKLSEEEARRIFSLRAPTVFYGQRAPAGGSSIIFRGSKPYNESFPFFKLSATGLSGIQTEVLTC